MFESDEKKLSDAYVDIINLKGRGLLIAKIEDCESCSTLTDDISLIMKLSDIINISIANIDFSSKDDLKIMSILRLTDVPAICAFYNGEVIGGWFGYDFSKCISERTEILSSLINAKLESYAD